MIPFKYRFHGYGGLKYVNKKGTVFRTGYFTCKIVKNRRHHSRLAVVVSKKTHKSAVGRNRIRRRVYSILEKEIPKLNDTYDIVCIVVSAEARTVPFIELEKALQITLYKAMVYKKD